MLTRAIALAIVDINAATLLGVYSTVLGARVEDPDAHKHVLNMESEAIDSAPDVAYSHALSFWKHLRQTEDFPAETHELIDKIIAKGELHRQICDCHTDPGLIDSEQSAFVAMSDLANIYREELKASDEVLKAQVEECKAQREAQAQAHLQQDLGNLLGVAMPRFGPSVDSGWEN
jgi:hypothetical protein